jgi:hypothetical protein
VTAGLATHHERIGGSSCAGARLLRVVQITIRSEMSVQRAASSPESRDQRRRGFDSLPRGHEFWTGAPALPGGRRSRGDDQLSFGLTFLHGDVGFDDLIKAIDAIDRHGRGLVGDGVKEVVQELSR